MISTALTVPDTGTDAGAPDGTGRKRGASRTRLSLVPRASRPPVVAAVGLGKTFRTGMRRRPRRALAELTLWVEPGEVFGLLGANGAGKTTLLKILIGVLAPTAGEAQVLGLPLGDRAARRRIGYLPELPVFPDLLTPREWLLYIARLRGLRGSTADTAVGAALERLSLTSHASTRFRALSKGLAQRVGLAQAILGEPQLLVLDEPMSGLDPIGRAEVRDLLGEMSAAGVTTLFSSHVLPDVHTLCTRVAVISTGRVVAAGAPETVLPAEEDIELVVSGGGDAGPLRRALASFGATVTERPGGGLLVIAPRGASSQAVRAVVDAGREISSLVPRGRALAEILRRGIADGGCAREQTIDAGSGR